MPIKPRFFVPGMPVHVIQRGRSREAVIFAENDYLAYLRWLQEGVERYQVAVHAHVIQTGTPLGNDTFRRKIEAKLQCKMGQARRDRPSKPKRDGM